jgi:hypothetical protein
VLRSSKRGAPCPQDETGLLQAEFHSGTYTGGHLEGGGNGGGNWINDAESYGCWRWCAVGQFASHKLERFVCCGPKGCLRLPVR